MSENILLSGAIIDFRNSYSELIAQWERQIAHGNSHPDLHFCMTLLDDYSYLNAYLCSVEYRIGFAINAYIVQSNWQLEFIGSGYNHNLALELANRELQLTYKALNDSETVTEDPKAKVYHYILANADSNTF